MTPPSTLDLTRSNCKKQFRAWSTSQVLHVLESPLLACIAPDILEIGFGNCFASDLEWVAGQVVRKFGGDVARNVPPLYVGERRNGSCWCSQGLDVSWQHLMLRRVSDPFI